MAVVERIVTAVDKSGVKGRVKAAIMEGEISANPAGHPPVLAERLQNATTSPQLLKTWAFGTDFHSTLTFIVVHEVLYALEETQLGRVLQRCLTDG